MFKGFFSGLAWGVLLAAVMVVVANEMAVRYDLTDEPVAAAVELPVGSAFDAVRTDVPPTPPGNADNLPGGAVPVVAAGAAQPESLPETGVPATVPAVPETGGAASFDAESAGVVAGMSPHTPALNGDARPGSAAGAGADCGRARCCARGGRSRAFPGRNACGRPRDRCPASAGAAGWPAAHSGRPTACRGPRRWAARRLHCPQPPGSR